MIGPSQWDEDVIGIYWTLVLGSGAAEKHKKEERSEEHKAGRSRVLNLCCEVRSLRVGERPDSQLVAGASFEDLQRSSCEGEPQEFGSG